MKRTCIVALMILSEFDTIRPSLAQGYLSGINRALAANKACSKALDANAQDLNRNQANVSNINATNYAVLCRYGRNVGYPIFARAAERVRSNQGCQKDAGYEGLVNALVMQANGYRDIVERDCQKAGM